MTVSDRTEISVDAGVAPVDGTHLYYEVTGNGPWMVLAHGGEGTRIHWWQQVALFRNEFRCVVYDARGFGQSPMGRLPAGANVYADDLFGLLDHLGISRANLVGHSMGGLAVSGVTQQHSDRVRRLVTSDSPFNFATAALSEWSAQMLTKLANGGHSGYAERADVFNEAVLDFCRD